MSLIEKLKLLYLYDDIEDISKDLQNVNKELTNLNFTIPIVFDGKIYIKAQVTYDNYISYIIYANGEKFGVMWLYNNHAELNIKGKGELAVIKYDLHLNHYVHHPISVNLIVNSIYNDICNIIEGRVEKYHLNKNKDGIYL